jgi:MFS superfamily sulfate permease-like transporter
VVALGSLLAVLVGIWGVVGGLLRLGRLTDLLAVPIRYGFVNGIALTIVVGQVASMAGVPLTSDFLPQRIGQLGRGIADGSAAGWSLVAGLAAVAALVVVRRAIPRLPAPVVVVGVVMLVAVVVDLGHFGIASVGALPSGLPRSDWGTLRWGDVAGLLPSAAAIALVASADTSVLSRALADRRGDDVDADRELVALGAANCSAGLMQGFPVSASFSRSSVAESLGVRSQIAGVSAALFLVLLLLVGGGVFRYLPRPVLAAVVVVAASQLVEVRRVARLRTTRPGEFWQAVAAFAAVALLGALPGLGVAVVIAVVAFVQRAWHPRTAELVRVEGVKGYHDRSRHPEGRVVPGLVLFRFGAPLFFANASTFRRTVLALAAGPPRAARVVIAAEPITDVDATGAEVLAALHRSLRAVGTELHFAELPGVVRDQLDRFGLVETIGRDRFHRTVGQAVRSYVADHGVDWTDWEDRTGPAGDDV